MTWVITTLSESKQCNLRTNIYSGDVVSLNGGNITLAADEKSVEISGFAGVKKIRVTARLEKDIIEQVR